MALFSFLKMMHFSKKEASHLVCQYHSQRKQDKNAFSFYIVLWGGGKGRLY